MLLPVQQPTPVPSTSSSPPVVPDISNLFSALVKAGVVPASAGSSSKAEEIPPADSKPDATKAYRETVLSLRVKLTSADITRYVTPAMLF